MSRQTATKDEPQRKERCHCECHSHPGAFRSPCGYCRHRNEDGVWVGGINGYWEKRKDDR